MPGIKPKINHKSQRDDAKDHCVVKMRRLVVTYINDVIDIQWLNYFYPHYIFNIDTYVKLNVIAYLIKVKE